MTQTASKTTIVYNSIDQFPSSNIGLSGCSPSLIQQWCGVHDSGTPGTAVPTSSKVTTPSINGFAREFDCTFTSSGGCRFSAFYNPSASDTTSTGFTYDVWVDVPVPSSINQLELDSNQGIASNTLIIYGWQCNFVSSTWDYTSQVGNASVWNHSAVPCTRAQFTAGYHHIILAAHRSGSNVTYDSVTFDNTTTNVAQTVNSQFSVSWTSGQSVVNFQFEGNGNGSATVYASLLGELNTIAGANFSSIGAEVRSLSLYGYGTYSCTMRASSTSTTSGGAGSQASGSVSSCFSFVNNSQTEIDAPEFEGQGAPGTLGSCTVGQVCAEFTNFNGISNSTNNDTPVATGDTAFHTYTWVWSSGQIIYKVDGVTKFTVSTNVPSTPAYIVFNHYGTNSASFGGTATAGTRWQYISNFTYSAP